MSERTSLSGTPTETNIDILDGFQENEKITETDTPSTSEYAPKLSEFLLCNVTDHISGRYVRYKNLVSSANVLFGSKRIGKVAKTRSSIVKVNGERILVIVQHLQCSQFGRILIPSCSSVLAVRAIEFSKGPFLNAAN